ncbi:ATP-binding protein [Bacillus massiliigorillae]|uniref:ATP-binding protein n=1 Tax=Bacillus massiliigorillae TaxID=1243664 RepID=UPI000693B181|nr:ATP-binding protein [Bacillus massiliigorillae]
MLKNSRYYQNQNRLILKSFMAIISVLLIVDISVSSISWKDNPVPMTIHIILITAMIISFLFYIQQESLTSKRLFIGFITIYLYVKFWTFPDTVIMLRLLAMGPIIPIFLFDRISFYVVSSLNFILGPLFILIIVQTDLTDKFQYLSYDGFGNTINFIAIQILLVFVFIGTKNRMQSADAFHKEMQQAKQLNSIGQLAATIAHEIRNPITVVKGFAQLLHQDKELNESQKYYVETMLNELEYTQIIINDFLSLAKPQTENIQIVQLRDELRKVCDLLASFANLHNIGITLHSSDNLAIEINPIELKQVLVNIIKNGIEAMSNPGFINVTVERVDEMAQIKVTDMGNGMSQEQIDKLGTPFYSLKNRGTGIGLTLSYNIIQKYKGKIVVESQLHKGTSFSIYLPLYEKDKRQQVM